MHKEHPAFTCPPPDAVLWRYMSLAQYLSLLQKQALFFARADKLGDSFEGSFSKANLALRPEIYPEHHEKLSSQFKSFEKLRRFILVNCWHESPHESDAMWQLYGSTDGSIAMRTDCRSFVESLTTDDDVHIGRVRYVDYDKYFIPEKNLFSPYLYKRNSFQHEQEVRAILPQLPSGASGALDSSTDTCAVGTYAKVTVPTLVREVVVYPKAEEWFLELVVSVTRRYDFTMPVRRSVLAERPVWG